MLNKFGSLVSLILVPTMAMAGTVSVVPEPGTFLLLAGGIGAAILLERKRRNKKG